MGYSIEVIPTPAGWEVTVDQVVAGRMHVKLTSFKEDGPLDIIDGMLAKAAEWIRQDALVRYNYS